MALRINEKEAIRIGLISPPPPPPPHNRYQPDAPLSVWAVLAFLAGMLAGMIVMSVFIPLPPPCKYSSTVGLDHQSTTMLKWKEVGLHRR